FWPLHRLNELRVDYIVDQIRTTSELSDQRHLSLEGLRCLDIGCGGGILSEALAALGAQVHGIDVVEKNIEIAKSHSCDRQSNIHYEYVSVEELMRRENRYDVVFNMEVVEHVANIESFMQACCTLVKSNGYMFIATINRTWFSFVAAILGAEYLLRWLPIGTHQWRRFRKPAKLRRYLVDNGLACIDSVGVHVNPVTRSFRLSKRQWVNYMLLAQKNYKVLQNDSVKQN
ncbi:MAG: bifunctional 2-polyprenyl-6-hydroxyphenol methylase/3-demethylubiquinol 3-O-methyltransferase UbiG, partial [Gammaproteobacteria bacterium]|nr:bifunctional 2-polyprenyl-6-hydroxyphenol methylase/3-demethylubiquinol 3-O-methyltransferase UbiG [Gammaproteobacteria bacterium]